VGAELLHADWQDEAKSRFRNFANAPKNMYIYREVKFIVDSIRFFLFYRKILNGLVLRDLGVAELVSLRSPVY
jgi:hypothetical protein